MSLAVLALVLVDFAVRWSCLDARPIARGLCGLCGLLKRFANCPTS